MSSSSESESIGSVFLPGGDAFGLVDRRVRRTSIRERESGRLLSEGVVDGVIAAPNDDLVTRLVWWIGVDEDGDGVGWSGVGRGAALVPRITRPLRVRVMGLSAPVERLIVLL